MSQHDCGNLTTCLFFTTSKLGRAFNKLADEAFSKTGLSPSHAAILYTINQKKAIPQKELGELLNLTPSTITRLVDKLIRKGYVEKQNQGKSVLLRANDEGLERQNDIIEAWSQLHRHYEGYLSEEESKTYLELSQKLLSKMLSEDKGVSE